MPKIERIDEEELDDFSAQLASADHMARQNKNTSKKRPQITAESIQTSLMQSLAAVPISKTGFKIIENIFLSRSPQKFPTIALIVREYQ